MFNERPVFLKDVADVVDGPDEVAGYVRHGWGPARGFTEHEFFPGTVLGQSDGAEVSRSASGQSPSQSAVTIAIAKKKGSNAVVVAGAVLREAEALRKQIVPGDMELIVTRNYGLTADEKVNELVEGLAVAILIVVALLTFGLGWREALIVAVAVPVVFGLTLAVNLMLGYTINRVTLFALILSLGLLVDDPIVDVENIVRHFVLRKKATRRIVLEAVAEIRPPLITATLAVIVSFLPMFFITGMMGPYMQPMALNVPVTMLMSMVVAFTITPWMAFHVLRRKYEAGGSGGHGHHADDDLEAVKQSRLYKIFYPLMAPLLHSRLVAWAFLLGMVLLTAAAMGLAAVRSVPLKMLPFDNKNELQVVVDMPEGTTLETTEAAAWALADYLARVPETTTRAMPDWRRRWISTAWCGTTISGRATMWPRCRSTWRARRTGSSRATRSGCGSATTWRLSPTSTTRMKLVETPPGPPVIASIVAEVYGQPDDGYEDLLEAADAVRARLAAEPGVVDLDHVREAPQEKIVFITDKEKAALGTASVTTEQIAGTLDALLGGKAVGVVRSQSERNPLRIELRLPIDRRTSGRPGPGPRQGRLGPTRPAGGVGPVETCRASTR